MGTKTPPKAVTIVSKDARNAAKAIGVVDREVQREIKGLIKLGVRAARQRAVGNMKARHGGGTYPRRAGMIEAMVDSIKLNRGSQYPWAFGSEFGAQRAWVFGRVTSQEKLSRRQFAPHGANSVTIRGQTYRGWLIAPAMEELDKFLTPAILEEIQTLVAVEHRKRGVGIGLR